MRETTFGSLVAKIADRNELETQEKEHKKLIEPFLENILKTRFEINNQYHMTDEFIEKAIRFSYNLADSTPTKSIEIYNFFARGLETIIQRQPEYWQPHFITGMITNRMIKYLILQSDEIEKLDIPTQRNIDNNITNMFNVSEIMLANAYNLLEANGKKLSIYKTIVLASYAHKQYLLASNDNTAYKKYQVAKAIRVYQNLFKVGVFDSEESAADAAINMTMIMSLSPKLSHILEGNRIMMDAEETMLKNPIFAKNFESVIPLYGTPH